MSRGGGVRRPSVSSSSSPTQMEHNPDIPPPSSPSTSPAIANTSNNNLPNSSTYISRSQPSTPSHSTGRANGRAWDPANQSGPQTSQSAVEGSEYPFPNSPSETYPPFASRVAEYTASTVSASSAPPRSPVNIQGVASKTSTSSTSHSRKSSHGKLSLTKLGKDISGILRRLRPSSPTVRDQSSIQEEPIGSDSLPAGSPSENEPGTGLEQRNSEPSMSDSTGPTLLHRRMIRNGGSGGGETIQPEQMRQHQHALNQNDRHRQSISTIPVMLTPPEDEKHITWQALSSPNQDASQEPSDGIKASSQEKLASATTSKGDGCDDKGGSAGEMVALNEQSYTTDILESVLSNGFEASEMWLRDALKVMLLSNPPDFRPATEAVRLISHALPCPLPAANRTPGERGYASHVDTGILPDSASEAPIVAAAAGYFMLPVTQGAPDGNDNGVHSLDSNDEGTTSALNIMTSAIQRVYGNDTKRIYIHVSHAISSNPAAPRLQSSNLTGSSVNSAATSAGSLVPSAFLTSPPHEGGFFSSTIFNSIVMAQDPISYASASGFPLSVLQRPLPNPALPPFSLHFSLLERYIPPPTITADTAMFSPYSSVLLDRVVELSPNGGSLLFIYPTKTGARQFLERYLGKVLDPLLRRLMVLHRLRDDLLWGISRMVAVEQMQEFEDLKGKLEHFCRRLSEKSKDEATNDKQFVGPNLLLPVSLVHAQKVDVCLNQFSWREWWTSQESTRIREVVKNHFSKASGHQESASTAQTALSESQNVGQEAAIITPPGLTTAVQYSGPMDLAREILDGVKASTTRPSSRGMGEAVFASSMVGKTASWPVVGEVGSGNYLGKRKQESETIEVGVFILRRQT
ncbi:hypothetical protein ABW19_dt0206798 [Dactylella cylindrospora]|nr:hypothetical protein ABW19_dt0206798 [Dactylella cylindrospora]